MPCSRELFCAISLEGVSLGISMSLDIATPFFNILMFLMVCFDVSRDL